MEYKWSEMSNSEIEVKLKELEFEYDKANNDITKLSIKLNELSKQWNAGKKIIGKRMSTFTKKQ